MRDFASRPRRRRRRTLIAGLAAAMTLAGCSSGHPAVTTLELARSKATFQEVGIDEVRAGGAEPLVAATTRIGATLTAAAGGGADGAGAVVSPWGVVALLAMLRAGATGATSAQLDDVRGGAGDNHGGSGAGAPVGLGAVSDLNRTMAAMIGQVEQWSGDPGSVSPTTPPATPLFQVGRAVLVPALTEVRRDFLDTLSRFYDTGVYPADFGSATLGQALGEWAAVNSASTWTATPLRVDSSTRLALLATAYLAAGWRYPFPLSGTSTSPFENADHTSAAVPTMHGTVLARVVHGSGFDALQLDYGTTLCLQIVLPPRGGSLADVVTPAVFTAARLALAAAPIAPHLVSLPRWQTTTWIRLPGPLAATDAFSDDASLPGLGSGVHVGDARAAAALTVGEKGTVVARPTAGTTPDGASSVNGQPTVGDQPVGGTPASQTGPDPFAVDRAFAYSVVDTATGLPLLMGTVRIPESG